MAEKSDKCSFCGRERKEVKLLISGIDANICDACVDQARLILKEEDSLKQLIINVRNRYSDLTDREQKNKILNYLTRKGFSYWEVAEILEQEIKNG